MRKERDISACKLKKSKEDMIEVSQESEKKNKVMTKEETFLHVSLRSQRLMC